MLLMSWPISHVSHICMPRRASYRHVPSGRDDIVQHRATLGTIHFDEW